MLLFDPFRYGTVTAGWTGLRSVRDGRFEQWGRGKLCSLAFVCFPRLKTRTEKWIDRGKSIVWPSHGAREWKREERETGRASNGGTMRDKSESKMALTQKKEVIFYLSLCTCCVSVCARARVCSCAGSAGEWRSLWIMGWLNLLCPTVRPMALKRIHAHIS